MSNYELYESTSKSTKRYLDIVKNCDKKLSKETNDNANEKNAISEKINKFPHHTLDTRGYR